MLSVKFVLTFIGKVWIPLIAILLSVNNDFITVISSSNALRLSEVFPANNLKLIKCIFPSGDTAINGTLDAIPTIALSVSEGVANTEEITLSLNKTSKS